MDGYRLSQISEIRCQLEQERDVWIVLCKKYLDGVDTALMATSMGLGTAGVDLLSTIIAAPSSWESQTVTILQFSSPACRPGAEMEHEKWGSPVDYMMTILGYSTGVGSMWRFPYMCMRNGGGAFLIPFVVFMIIGAVPCVFLEMAIGQFSQSGAVKVWNLCPPFKGMGIGNVLISIFFSNYYSALFAWLIYYFYHSFSPNIPWSNCDNPWNTPSCISFDNVRDDAPANSTNVSTAVSRTVNVLHNSSALSNYSALANGTKHLIAITPAEEFWT
ncbi:sodium-dependent noradrenaline transporter-like [Haliotis rubra]|uniref:sodium-dependent noradrenaline transporter-like n=1 Tax=Haliotis rubra TaxID=36100 RepID=UPI001EE5C23A|nr:sodium-dependent noradrenaline transporter-like [Haliotis rubra]